MPPPIAGSAHATLVLYWAERLERNVLHARQVSARGGELWCEWVRAAATKKSPHSADRVKIAGRTVLYLRGQISV